MNQQKVNQQKPKKQFFIMLDTSEPNPVKDCTPELSLGIAKPLQELFEKHFPTCKSAEVHNGK